MKVVGLISGGKDSIYSLQKCVEYGHELVCVANLAPEEPGDEEIDSYCFQTVGHGHVRAIADALRLPLVRGSIRKGASLVTDMEYPHQPTEQADEVEQLYALLARCKAEFPDLTAVCSGAILSNYQRLRVENVCGRLGLVSLAYIWQRDQDDYISDLVESGVDARIVKVAAMGLKPRRHLGRSVADLSAMLADMEHCHSAGEGGEYETIVVDSPLFHHPLVLSDAAVEMLDDNAVCPTGLLRFTLTPGEPSEPRPLPRAVLPPAADPVRVPRGSAAPVGLADLPALPGHWHSSCGKWATASVRRTGGDGAKERADAALTAALDGCRLGRAAVCYTHVWASNIDDFAETNKGYSPHFGLKAPSRAFVEAGHGAAEPSVCVELFACSNARETLHVQSISEWAPPCIGPYSQATTLRDCVMHAGMIGLHPPTVQLVGPAEGESLVAAQTARALKSYRAVLPCVASAPALTGFGLAFTLSLGDEELATVAEQFSSFAGADPPPPLAVVAVSAMPKQAAFELQLLTGTTSAGRPSVRQLDGGGVLCAFQEQVFAVAVLPAAGAAAAVRRCHDALAGAGAECGYARVFAPVSPEWTDLAAVADACAAIPSRPTVTVLPCSGAVLLGSRRDGDCGLVLLWGCRSAE